MSVASLAEVSLSDQTITVEGLITNADADRFIELAYGKPIKQVIFRRSGGGEWRAGLRLGNWLTGRGVTTVVEGFCGSACAIAFLGDSERIFSLAKKEPVLVYHLPYLLTNGGTVDTLQHTFFSYIEFHTKRPVDERFKAAIIAAKPPLGAVFFYAEDDPNIIKFGGLTLFCKGDEKKLPADCAQTNDISARSLGFITGLQKAN